MQRWLGWLVLGSLGVLMLSGLLAHAPDRIRPLLLTALAFGLVVGWFLGFLAGEFGLTRRIAVSLATMLLIGGGLANTARMSFRQLEAQARQRVQENPQDLLALRLLENLDSSDPAAARSHQQQRLRLRPTFRDYLAARVSAVAWFSSPWPEVFWGLELMLAGMAGSWAARRQLPKSMEPGVEPPAGTQKERVDP